MNAKWFDDRPSKTGRHVYELGLSMPWDMEFGYRYRHIHGVHGGASSHTAFLAVVASAKNAFRTEYHHIS